MFRGLVVPETPRGLCVEMYRRMFLIRRFDERVAELQAAGAVPGAVHLTIGQEAAVVGACLGVQPADQVVGTHRCHGQVLAKGAHPGPLMAEVLGRRTGVCKGKGGSQHLADVTVGFLGAVSIVGGGLPIAAGAALSAKMRDSGQVVLCFFGEGAANQGAFHESLNLSAVWSLPVVFFCENNQYAVSTSFRAATSIANVADRAVAYGMPGFVVDGQDPLATQAVVAEAAARARSAGPSLIEAKTYRYKEHSQGLRLEYRADAEIKAWMERDPLSTFRSRVLAMGIPESELARIEDEVDSLVGLAVAFAHSSELPRYDEAFEDVFASGTAS